jgi:hypothetical protein
MKMTELYQEYTVRSLMERTDLTYTKSYEVIRKMREKGLVQDVKKVNGVGVMNAKRYGLLMDPVQFCERNGSKTPRRHRPQVFSTTHLI